uniref:RING-type domain-containing protein n=1 Tax=Amphora coffeiformis TaxID=265554 RepID=A0A7S3LHV8_9STRA|eukprot:scaffold689_cov186-Amphora_coffeaeformis.AAC.5
MTQAAVIATPPASPERRAMAIQGAASWTRSTSRHHPTNTIAQRQRNRTRRQAPISSHVLGFRRNRTWRQAFMPSSRTSTASTTTATPSIATASSSNSSSSSSPASSFFRLGRRANPSSSSQNTDNHKNIKTPGKGCKESIDSLLLLLKALRSHDPHVQQVVLDGTALPWQYTAALLRAVGDSPHVWRVQLRKVGANDRIATALLECVEKSTSLIDLDLSKNHLGYQSMLALQQGWYARVQRMQKQQGTNNTEGHDTSGACPLQRLNLEGNPLNADALHVLSYALTAGATTNLQILKLGRNMRCGFEGMMVLCQELLGSEKCPVTWLDVRGNNLGDAGVWPLAQALSEPSCTLEYLSLQRNNISNEGVAAIAQAMELNVRLRTLDLQRNPDLDDEGAAALVEALWYNHVFTKLKIRHTRVNDMRVKNELFDLLVMNTYGPALAASTKESLQRMQTEPAPEESTAPCVICFEANRTMGHTFGVLLPCRHDNACWACCQRLRGHCHMCRTPIVKIMAA